MILYLTAFQAFLDIKQLLLEKHNLELNICCLYSLIQPLFLLRCFMWIVHKFISLIHFTIKLTVVWEDKLAPICFFPSRKVKDGGNRRNTLFLPTSSHYDLIKQNSFWIHCCHLRFFFRIVLWHLWWSSCTAQSCCVLWFTSESLP